MRCIGRTLPELPWTSIASCGDAVTIQHPMDAGSAGVGIAIPELGDGAETS